MFFIYIVFKNLNDSVLRYKDSLPRVLFIYLFVLQENLNLFGIYVSILFFIMYMHAYKSYLIMKIFFIKDGELVKPFIPCTYCVTFLGLRLLHSGPRH